MLLYTLLKPKKKTGEGKGDDKKSKTKATARPAQAKKTIQEIIGTAKTAALTTRSADGKVTSRVIIPATSYDPSQTKLTFFGNNAADSFDEIPPNAHVNVSWADTESQYCASYIGTANIVADHNLIAQYWSNAVAAWYGPDVNESDPRVIIIEVTIRPDSGSVDAVA